VSVEVYVVYILACLVFAIVPGPNVTLVAANTLSYGTRAGLASVAGGQFGLALMMGVLAVGLASVIEAMGWLFDWLRLAGAAYLVWLGWKLWRSPAMLGFGGASPRPRGGFFLQGLLVVSSNPKALLFFGAFIPQFVNPAGDQVAQVMLLGVTTIVITSLSDAAYVLAIARARHLLSDRHARGISRVGAGLLMGGGLWLAFLRAR
jgi:threonine/homoserine/homoserine lactone efflux protein